MNIAFCGHSDFTVTEVLKQKIISTITKLAENENIKFYCGGYGSFDLFAAHTARSLKSKYPFIKLLYITPYIDNSRLELINEQNLYDEIIYPNLENTPRRFAILKRNEYIVQKSDLIIAYVNRTYGGAYKMLCYARKLNKPIINLVDN